MKKLLSVISGLAAILLCASCDVHQFPGDDPVDPTLVNLHLNLVPAGAMQLYPNGQELVETRDYVAPQTGNLARYIVEIYIDEKFSHELVYSTVVTRPENQLPDTLHLEDVLLHAQHYRVCVWQDLRSESAVDADKFYVTSAGMNKIAVLPPSTYSAWSDSKLAQTATYKVDLTPYAEKWHKDVTCDVPLVHPLGKLVLVSTDLKKFLDTYVSATPGAKLEDYDVRVEYQLYIPTGYDVPNWNRYWGENLNSSAVGYSFRGKAVKMTDTEALVGFDYILMDSRATSVRLKVVTRDKSGEVVNTSREVEVPLRPNHITVIRGEMLVLDTGGGIGIDPEFGGDINIYV